MGDKRPSRMQDKPVQPMSCRITPLRPSPLIESSNNLAHCRGDNTNRNDDDDDDGCNITKRESRGDSPVVPLALSINKLRLTPVGRKYYSSSSIDVPLPSISSKEAITSIKTACNMDTIVENSTPNHEMKQRRRRTPSIELGMRDFTQNGNAEKGIVVSNESWPRQKLQQPIVPLPLGGSDVQFCPVLLGNVLPLFVIPAYV